MYHSELSPRWEAFSPRCITVNRHQDWNEGLHRNVGASRFNEPDGRQGCVLARTVESNQGGRFDSNESVADSFPSGAVGFKSWSATILGAFSLLRLPEKPPVGKPTRCPRSPLRRSSPLR
ncbi:hypothetical protein TNCV_1096951 [Trichonephila clavipes]|nr:hypothetical protein TNCV_1096951 [Trichonephila clavipes]